MQTRKFARAFLLLSMLAPAGFTQRPKPPPAPPAPAPAPAQDAEQREKDAKERERLQRARQAEAERARQQQQAQDQEQARIRRAREASAGEQPAAPPATNPRIPAKRAEMRETVRNMFEIEGVHRDRLARIDRLIALYSESGDQTKLAEVQELKRREDKRYTHIIEQIKEKLGPAYSQFQPKLNAGQQRRATPATPAIPPVRPPAPRREPPAKNDNGGGQ